MHTIYNNFIIKILHTVRINVFRLGLESPPPCFSRGVRFHLLLLIKDLSLHCITTHGEMGILLLLLQSLPCLLLLSQLPPDSTSLFHPQVLANVLVAGRGLANALFLLLVVHGEDTGDGLTHRFDLGDFGCGSTGDLSNVQFGEFLAEVSKSFKEFFLGKSTEFVCLDHFESYERL